MCLKKKYSLLPTKLDDRLPLESPIVNDAQPNSLLKFSWVPPNVVEHRIIVFDLQSPKDNRA